MGSFPRIHQDLSAKSLLLHMSEVCIQDKVNGNYEYCPMQE